MIAGARPSQSLLLLLLVGAPSLQRLGELAAQGVGSGAEVGSSAAVVRRHLAQVAFDLRELPADRRYRPRRGLVLLAHGWLPPSSVDTPSTCVDLECAVAILLTIDDVTPRVEAARFVAPDAVVAGDVELGQDVTLWFGVVARAEYSTVRIGARTNVQDGSILHADPDSPCTVGEDVTIGHRAVVHGCTIEDGVLIGMGAVVLNGAVVGAGSLVAAGAVVREGMEVPPNSLVAGVPAEVRRDLGEGREPYPNVAGYLHLGELYAATTGQAG